MIRVIYEDKEGFKRASLIRDHDPLTAAPSGIPVGPPNVEDIDWDEVKRTLNNLLVMRGLDTTDDVSASNGGLRSAVEIALRKPLLNLYIQRSQE